MLTSREHYDLMAHFEQEHRNLRLDREPKELWRLGHIYQNGEANALFLAYRQGYAYGRMVERLDGKGARG